MQKTISRKVLTGAGAEKKSIKKLDGGFSIVFDTFSEVAMFFRRIGSEATYNEHNRYSTNADFLEDDAFQLTADASVEITPGSFEVYWAGWELNES